MAFLFIECATLTEKNFKWNTVKCVYIFIFMLIKLVKPEVQDVEDSNYDDLHKYHHLYICKKVAESD